MMPNSQNKAEAEATSSDFREYLKAEYSNIAEAHFRTIEAISSFFRYYLLIMSAPITVLALFIGLSDNPKEIADIVESLRPLLVATLIVISLAGFFVMLYIISLRMDVILYARTINAIRKHFYDQAAMDIDTKLRTRVLPQTSVQPGYVELPYFLPVVLSFALFNTFYLTLALILSGWSFSETAQIASWVDRVSLWSWLGFLFLPVHCGVYIWYAHYREHAYLRSFTLGVDIDGVLNRHRHHFCKLLKENVGKKLDPDSITTMPLHDCPALGVSLEDEKQVFNDPQYWIQMPPADDAAHNLARLRNLNLKIHIFTNRPWPDTSGIEQVNCKAIHKQWSDEAAALTRKTYGGRSLRSIFNRIRMRFGNRPVEQLTKCWLRLHNINYDELTIEQGSEDVADPQGHFNNRFYIAKQKKMRFFVEDDLEKAIKLAYICDVVFLLENPYNRNSVEKCQECRFDCEQTKKDIPGNVIPVKSWDEIYRHIRRLS